MMSFFRLSRGARGAAPSAGSSRPIQMSRPASAGTWSRPAGGATSLVNGHLNGHLNGHSNGAAIDESSFGRF